MNPFQVPEICQLIAYYLDQEERAWCTQVCRVWRGNFLPFVWRNLSITSSSDAPKPTTLAKYNHLIKEISFIEYSPPKYPTLQCSNLTSLTMQNIGKPIKLTLSKLPLLADLTLYTVDFMDCSEFWRVASQKLLNLRILRAFQFFIDSNAIEYFWITCSRLETLKLQDIRLPKPPNTSLTFQKITRLKTSNLFDFSEQDLQVLISRCPSLLRLSSTGNEPRIPMTMCSPDFIQGTCPMLESLNIMASNITDKDLAQVLGGMRTVKVLKASQTGFGTMSFAALRPHLHELQNLSISSFLRGKPKRATGAMLHEILVSCENLVKLDGPYVRAKDVMLDNRPWIATKLQRLSFVVKFPRDCDPSLHKAMFEQISRLTSLKILSFRDYSVDHHSLDFRLSHGMGQLKGLSRLEDLYLEGTIQQMEREDFLWLFENLDSFKRFYGKPNQDPSKLRKFKGLKKANGERVKFIDYFD